VNSDELNELWEPKTLGSQTKDGEMVGNVSRIGQKVMHRGIW